MNFSIDGFSDLVDDSAKVPQKFPECVERAWDPHDVINVKQQCCMIHRPRYIYIKDGDREKNDTTN